MVSIRRRKLLGMGLGLKTYTTSQPPGSNENHNSTKDPSRSKSFNIKSFGINSMVSTSFSPQKQVRTFEAHPSASNPVGCSTSKEERIQRTPVGVREIKRRKRQRRKQFQDQEPCLMRGVYFKNMKWQAAIKVEKKQIHLGTVGSQEEAARLYDRAAFMCGREPNFELSEEEKNELRKFDWETFLTVTRSAITSKKQQKKVDSGKRKKQTDLMVSLDEKVNQHIHGPEASEYEIATSSS